METSQTGDRPSQGPPTVVPTVPRRQVLRTGGAVVAGVTAGAVGSIVATDPAAAANGDAVRAATATTATDPEAQLILGGEVPAGTSILTVADSPGPYGATAHSSAVFGLVTNNGGDTHPHQGVVGAATMPNGVGVLGISNASQSTGVVADGSGVGPSLRIGSSGQPPMDRDSMGEVLRGSLEADANGDLWYCTTTSLGGTWTKVAGPSAIGALHLLDVPIRVFDSRDGQPDYGGGIKGVFIDGEERTITCSANGLGVVHAARAVLVNLTGVDTSGAGWLAAFAAGVSWSGHSNLNWAAAKSIVSNEIHVRCGPAARITIRCASFAHVVVDVIGYYR